MKEHKEFWEYVQNYALIQVGKCAFYDKEIEKELWINLLMSIEQMERFQAEQQQVSDDNLNI